MRLLAVVLGTLVLSASVPATWHTFRANGISVRYPAGWTATTQPLTGVTSPQQILAVASYSFPRNPAGADGCWPQQALARLPANGAFIFGWGYGQISAAGVADFPPRPKHFTLTRYEHAECFGPSYAVTFRDHGRCFQFNIAFGRHASAGTRATVLRILDSFRAA